MNVANTKVSEFDKKKKKKISIGLLRFSCCKKVSVHVYVLVYMYAVTLYLETCVKENNEPS